MSGGIIVSFRRLLLFLIIGWFATESALSQHTLLNRNYDRSTSILVESIFGEGLKSSYHPYLVTIRNGSQRDITWTIRFEIDGATFDYQSRFEIHVDAGSEVKEQLLVHVPPSKYNRSSSYRNVSVFATAPGLDPARQSDSHAIDRNWPAIAMSKRLAQRNLSRLANAKKKQKKGNEYFASSFEELPNNWKGFTCLDALLVDESTWYSLPREQKLAAMTWVRFGGGLELYTEKDNATLESLGFVGPGENGANEQSGQFSLGAVEIRKWDGTDLPVSLINRYQATPQFDDMINNDFKKDWGLLNEFGGRSFNPFLVLILLIIFAVLVGPVNLFRFARAGQRHRMFVTTPIISLGATFVIVVIILVQDGMGGKGQRVAFVDVQSAPEQRQLQILQQQISRTGVMLRSGFENDEKPAVVPVNIPPSRWNPMSNRSSQRSNYQFSGANYSGDFFRSRNEQGYHLRTVRSSRSRIERRESGTENSPPVLFSSLEFSLVDFFYVDEKGVVWRSPADSKIDSGQEIKLTRSSANELNEWINSATETFALTDQKNIRSLRFRKRRYFGFAADPTSLLIASHSAIRWNDDQVLVSGLVVEP